MAEKDIRKMSRQELLELLIERSKENEELRAKLEEAQNKIEELNVRPVEVDPVVTSAYQPHQAGSLSEEAFRVGHILEAAQKSADFYLKSIERMHRESAAACEKAESETEAKCRALREETQAHAYQLLEESRKKCEDEEKASREKADKMIVEAQKQADDMIEAAKAKCAAMEEDLKKRYDEACEMVRKDADRNWEAVNNRLDSICAEHNRLCEQIAAAGEKKRKW